MSIKKAAEQLMDAMEPKINPDSKMGIHGIESYTMSSLHKPIANLLIALGRMSDPNNQYNGDGIYRVGKYGIAITQKILNDDPEDEDPFEYYSREDTIIKVTKSGSLPNIGEDVFEVTILNAGTTGDQLFDAYEAKELESYNGTDHSIFGSGNTSLICKL